MLLYGNKYRQPQINYVRTYVPDGAVIISVPGELWLMELIAITENV